MDFPKSFNPLDNNISRLLKAIVGDNVLVVQDLESTVDLEFSSNFIQDSRLHL
jgi:hypothetical protein